MEMKKQMRQSNVTTQYYIYLLRLLKCIFF